MHISKEERDLQDKAVHGYTFKWTRNDPEVFVPAERAAEQLYKMQPVFSLVRQWCGSAAMRFDEAVELKKEVTRLRCLVEKAARQISDDGRPRVAAKLIRELNSKPGALALGGEDLSGKEFVTT
jgi:hypothetical protein